MPRNTDREQELFTHSTLVTAKKVTNGPMNQRAKDSREYIHSIIVRQSTFVIVGQNRLMFNR